jgi:phenylacetate-coenzyme A ligase PaaK-like adenylate-forming protein
VRYRIGDIASVEQRKEGYPFVLTNLIGRTRDFISLPNGKKIHGSMLNKVFKQYDIVEYQIEQYEDLHCVVRLEWKVCADIEQQTTKLSNVLQMLLENVKLDILTVPKIERAKNSKLRNIISHT